MGIVDRMASILNRTALTINGSVRYRDFELSRTKLTITGPEYLYEIELPFKTKPGSVSTSTFGDKIAIGYPIEKAVFVVAYNFDSGTWEQVLLTRNADRFGTSVAIRSNRLVVASFDIKTYLYKYTNSKWELDGIIQQNSIDVGMTPDSTRVLISNGNNVTCYIIKPNSNWFRIQVLESTDPILGLKVFADRLIVEHKKYSTSYILSPNDNSNSDRTWIPEQR